MTTALMIAGALLIIAFVAVALVVVGSDLVGHRRVKKGAQ
jgi:hypothetical protein